MLAGDWSKRVVEYTLSKMGNIRVIVFKSTHVAKNISRVINTTASIWREKMIRYLVLGIICSSKLSFPREYFLELRSRKTVRFSEQIMPVDKYLTTFSSQTEAMVYITQALWNVDDITHTSLSASCSLRESDSEATLPSSFSFARLTRLISSSFSAPLRSRCVCSISICLSLSRIVASRLEMVLDELECSALTENSWALMLEMEESFSCKSLSRHSH